MNIIKVKLINLDRWKRIKKKIIKFREDELHHKDIAYEKGATKKGLFNLDKIIKTGSKLQLIFLKKFNLSF
jgi:ubiquinone biosynthesis monooxygenase Coq7